MRIDNSVTNIYPGLGARSMSRPLFTLVFKTKMNTVQTVPLPTSDHRWQSQNRALGRY